MVLEPARGMSLSVDWFYIRLANVITNGISQSTILGDLAQYGGLITRGAVQPGFPNIPGPITNIDQRYINLGGQHIKGIDIDARYASPVQPWGRMKLGVNGTYFTKYDVQQTDGTWAGFISNAFGAAATGITPRLQTYATIGWDRGPWAVTMANRYQSAYTDWQTDGNGDERKVSSMSLWDLQAMYTGFRNVTLTLGAKNLFDTNPPATNQQNTFQLGFDASYYDARARFVYGSITVKWP